MSYFLKQIVPSDSGPPIEIHIDKNEFHIGQKTIAAFTRFPLISIHHAVFYTTDKGDLCIKDSESLHGVFVNNVKIGSALKVLKVGDIIGFGTHKADEGFVCILCETEVIVISDDDDESNKNIKPSSCTSFEDSNKSNTHLGEKFELSSDNRYESASCKTESLSRSTESRNKPIPQNVINNLPESHDSKYTLKYGNIINDEKSISNSGGKYSSKNCNYSLNISKFDDNRNSLTPQNVMKDSTESQQSRNALKSANYVKNGQIVESESKRKSPKGGLIKKCVIPVVRCDSKDFRFPPDKENSSTESNALKHPTNQSRRNVKQSHSRTSESIEDEEQPGISIEKNLSTGIVISSENLNETISEHRKRKKSDVSGHKSQDVPSTSKKIESILCRPVINSKSEAESSSNLHNKSDECYSQIDEVIYISDDDDYLDFNSPRYCINIKKEPEENEDVQYDAIIREIFEGESEYVPSNADFDDRIESIEAIQAFVSKSDRSSVSIRNVNVNTAQNSDSISSDDSDNKSDSATKLSKDVVIESSEDSGSKPSKDLISESSEDLDSKSSEDSDSKSSEDSDSKSSEDSDSKSSDDNKSFSDSHISDISAPINKGSDEPSERILNEPKSVTNRQIRVRDHPKHDKNQPRRRNNNFDEEDNYNFEERQEPIYNSEYEKTETEIHKRSNDGDLFSSKSSSSRPLKVVKILERQKRYDAESTEIQEFARKAAPNSGSVKNMLSSNTAQHNEYESKSDSDESTASKKSSHINSFLDDKIFNISTYTNKGSEKPRGIILTEPKPMTYRSRRRRARDEDFVEKDKSLRDPKFYRNQLRSRKNKSGEDESCCTDKRKEPIRNSICAMNQVKSSTSRNDTNLISSKSSCSRASKGVKPLESTLKGTESVKNKESELCERKKYTHSTKSEKNQVETKKSSYRPESSERINSRSQKTSHREKQTEKVSSQIETGNRNITDDHHESNKSSSHKCTLDKEKSPNHELFKRSISSETNNSNKLHNVSFVTNIIFPTKTTTSSSKEKCSSSRNVSDKGKSKENKVNLTEASAKETNTVCKSSIRRCNDLSNPYNTLYSEISFLSGMKKLINMKTIWLLDKSKLTKEDADKIPPPPSITSGPFEICDLPTTYISYDLYASCFYPMIMLEIWEYMFTESKKVYSSNKNYKKFYFSVISVSSLKDCVEIKCESIVNDRVSFCPREGVIAILEMKQTNLEGNIKCSPLFGYIHKHKIEPMKSAEIKASCWKCLPESWLESAKKWTFNAYIKKEKMSYHLSTIMKGNGLCYIRNKLKLVDALYSLKHSPLLKDILQPREITFTTEKYQLSPTREYTSSQMEIIKSISDEINEPSPQPKILLLQAPPGTGKTHTIIGLLEKLFYSCKNDTDCKILVTAPSDAAVDEIGCRLIELNENSGWRDINIKFVRVGLEKQIHQKMVPYFVDNKARDLYVESCRVAALKEKELKREIDELERRPPGRDRDEKINNLKRKLQNLINDKPINCIDNSTPFCYKITALEESPIVLSTLSCCGMLLLQTFIRNTNVKFSCCIVDEATQCNESEILQPLVFGMNKLILVGDSEQLPPPVLSNLISRHGFRRSMFQRFSRYFERLDINPVLSLTEQLRMHSAICEFPSKYFYSQKLQTRANTCLRDKDFPVNPYLVMDISAVPESNDEEKAHIMQNICTFIVKSTNSELSIGIIVSHLDKRPFYMEALQHHPCYNQIEINTVDGFRSREKDVVILSTINATDHLDNSDDRSFLSCEQELNIAITRARKCLIICVNMAEVTKYKVWRALIDDAQERQLFKRVTSSEHTTSVLEQNMKR